MLLLWVIVSGFFTYAPVIVICNEYFESFIIFAIVIGIFTAIYKFLYMIPIVGDITFWGLWIWGLNIVLAHYKKGFIVAYVIVFIIAGLIRIICIIDALINALRKNVSEKKQNKAIPNETNIAPATTLKPSTTNTDLMGRVDISNFSLSDIKGLLEKIPEDRVLNNPLEDDVIEIDLEGLPLSERAKIGAAISEIKSKHA